MASNPKKNKNRPVQRHSKPGTADASPKQAKTSSVPRKSLWSVLDAFFAKHLNVVLIISVIMSAVMGGFLFDVKISTGGDDSHYVEMAYDFMKGRSFPSWHGPLYSVFLSLPMMIFGVNIIVLKILSFVFVLGQLFLFFYTFRNLISPALFSLIMLIVAVNSSILYFASQTYSEALFMLLQSLTVFLFIRIYLIISNSERLQFKTEALHLFALGFFVFLVSLTRNIGIVMLLAMILFLLIEKRFRSALMLTGSYILFLIPFRTYKSVVWNEKITQGPDQISELLTKNPYNKAMGTEDFAGMVDRFIINAKAYLSKHFMISIGLHDPASTEKSALITIVLALLFLLALYFAFRKSKPMLFVSIYLGGAITATFIALHQSWDQLRMIVIFIPMLLLLLAWGIQQLSTNKRYTFTGIVLLIFLVVIFFKTFDQSSEKIKANRKVLSRNMKGNMYYGFTPDWQNYLKMSEWVGENIPDDKVVASRKPSMSYIYSKGREFYGMFRVPTEAPGDLIKALEKRTDGLVVLPNKSISTQWPSSLQWSLKKANLAYVAEGAEIFGVYKFNGPQGNEVIRSLNQLNIVPFSTDSLLKKLNRSTQTTFAVSPDSLINTLRVNNVEYVIVASLRANPNMNTGNIINNIQRYLYFVELKYPGILELVHQIGADAEEPAWLYRINYTLYGL